MNQILFVKDDIESNNKNIEKKKSAYKTLFLFSFIVLIILITLFFYIQYHNQSFSNQSASRLSNSYQIYRLYSNSNSSNIQSQSSYIIDTIEIPKLNISYPILSELTEDLLKVSPCRFYGDIHDNSNLCIAGHNFDNESFFSQIRYLDVNDQVIIVDNNNVSYTFFVFDVYEVDSSDLSPIYQTVNNSDKELTLVTCNNQNNRRIILKALRGK